MQFSYLLVNLNRHLTNLFAYCKINDLEIIFILQGFLIFALHCVRNTQVRKKIELIINFISSSFRVSINMRVLRTIFRVARLSADQRAIQKKDEHRFSIFFKEQPHKEEPQVNPNEVGDVWAIELQSCAEFESKSHLT